LGLKQGVKAAWDKTLSPLFEEFSAEVMVQSVDTVTTTVDPLYDEPIAEKRFTDPVAVRARVKLEKERLVLPGGEDIEIDGRIRMRSEELEAQGLTLEFGSRLTFQGERYTVVHREARAELGEEFLLVQVAVVKETA